MLSKNLDIPIEKEVNIYVRFNPKLITSENKILLPKIFLEFKKNKFYNYQLYFSSQLENNTDFEKLFDPSDFSKISYDDNIEKVHVHIAISIGGDGTLLWTHKKLKNNKNVVFFSVNAGTLGFLTSFTIEQFDKLLFAISGYFLKSEKSPKLFFSELSRLKAQIFSKDGHKMGEPLCSINELLLKKIANYCPKFVVFWKEQKLLSFYADALILSTVQGSTGYNSSVGGPILLPGNQSFVLTAIAPYGANFKPIAFNESDIVTIRLDQNGAEKEAIASSDCNDEQKMPEDAYIEISKDQDYPILLGHFDQNLEEVWAKKLQNLYKWD